MSLITEVQGIAQWRHDEMRQLAEIKLRFLDSVEPFDYVAQVSALDRRCTLLDEYILFREKARAVRLRGAGISGGTRVPREDKFR